MKRNVIFACATMDEKSHRFIALAGGRCRRLFSAKSMTDEPISIFLVEMPENTDVCVRHGSGVVDEWQLNFVVPGTTAQIGLVFETGTDVRRTHLRFAETTEVSNEQQ